jgi:hypothetical protein
VRSLLPHGFTNLFLPACDDDGEEGKTQVTLSQL